MSDGQTLPAVRYRLSAYRYPLSYWTVFPKAGGGARLRRRGDSPALPRGLRVVFASLRGRIRAAALEYISGRKRVQAPAAPGFYRSCADALTDGFCPQSGLVQRRVLYAACGSAPFGGWRHHLCHGVKRVTGFSVAQGLPTNPVPLPPLFRGHYGCWAMASI